MKEQGASWQTQLSVLLGRDLLTDAELAAESAGLDLASFIREAVSACVAPNPLPKLRENFARRPLTDEHSQMALVLFSDAFTEILESGLGAASFKLRPHYELLRHNPTFRTEAEALRHIIEGVCMLRDVKERIQVSDAADGSNSDCVAIIPATPGEPGEKLPWARGAGEAA